MDIQAYIESGILEAYVLQALDAKEQAEVEAHIARYPELAAEVAAIERAMEQYAEMYAEPAPTFVQESIWESISGQANTNNDSQARTMPLVAERRRQYSWANAAILAVLIGSLAVNIMLWSQRDKTEQQLAVLQQDMTGVRAQQDSMQAAFANYTKQSDMLADTAMQAITMKSMVPGQPMAATVYWNKQTGEAYLAMQKLPTPEKGKQYQMWVIKDGTPVSMGTLSTEAMQKLKMEVKDGQAFAISLEKEGGNSTPTEVYVLGKV